MLKRIFYNTAKHVIHPVYRQMRGLTLGTRTVVLREDREVMLVRHTYAPGWLLPGGGVERGETVYQAATREVKEEAAITADEEPLLHGLFLNERQFQGDHVACFVLRTFTCGEFRPNLEIAEAKFFPTAALPEGTTGGTRRRLAEVLHGAPVPSMW